MNPKLAKLLTRAYPPLWRNRYGAEIEELLETGRGGFYVVANVLWSGIVERIFTSPARTLEESPGRLRSLCAQAPWAIFGLAPIWGGVEFRGSGCADFPSIGRNMPK
jgi:hypothetical protein